MNFISDQQRDVVLSTARYKLVNGCAGSHKTDTLVKCCVHDLAVNKRPVLFLTMVGSVTDEIRSRLQTQLGVEFRKVGMSNHFVGQYEGVPVSIANFDAWVHLMLTKNGLDDCRGGDAFSQKAKQLMQTSGEQKLVCYMKNGSGTTEVGLLLIDEVQDLGFVKMQTVVNICSGGSGGDEGTAVFVAGDYIQTLFPDSNSVMLMEHFKTMHSMNVFKKLNPAYFLLNVCMRCPKAHVMLTNYLLGDILVKHGLPPMETSNTNMVDKPFLFTHLRSSANVDSDHVAEQVTTMIKVLMDKDTSIIPDDIAIIMAKSNGNEVFFKLEHTLKCMYAQRGGENMTTTTTTSDCEDGGVLYMRTRIDGGHEALNWDRARGKTKLLSVHGDKGRGHKVVFFLGLTEGSVPQEVHVGRPSELVAESWLNVGLTRSLKYLFIGFMYKYPSRYLEYKKKNLLEYVYHGWNEHHLEEYIEDEIPEPYMSIRTTLRQVSYFSNLPKALYRGVSVWLEVSPFGLKHHLQVTNDVAKAFEQSTDFVNHPWNPEWCVEMFGEKQLIRTPFEEDHYMIFGVMAELLIQRQVNPSRVFGVLRQGLVVAGQPHNIVFTDDDILLGCMQDVRNQQLRVEDLDKHYLNHRDYTSVFKLKPILKAHIRKLVQKGKTTVHEIFSGQDFQQQLQRYICMDSSSNRSLDAVCIWNVTLFYYQYTQRIYRSSIHAFFGYFNENLDVLHDNVDEFVKRFITAAPAVDSTNTSLPHVLPEFEKELQFVGSLTPDEIIEVGLRPEQDHRVVSLVGRLDILHNGSLFEIKASRRDSCSHEWIIQCLMYALMLHVNGIVVSNRMYVVNILRGCLWSWDIASCLSSALSLESVVQYKIGPQFQWHKFETTALLRSIAGARLRTKQREIKLRGITCSCFVSIRTTTTTTSTTKHMLN